MNQEIIKDKDILIAKIVWDGDWPEGLNFYTDEKDSLQVDTWNHNAGKHLKAHGHKICDRTTDRINEMIFVKSGKVKVSLYNKQDELIAEKELKGGDFIIMFAGGHAYDILEDKTQVLEIKNGPYVGLEKDKKIIEE